MSTYRQLSKIAAAIALSVGVSTAAIAQETSSAIRGSVQNDAGVVVSGASVTLIDSRTGTTRQFETNETGAFNARGLRVGGPYTMVVSSDAGSQTIENIFLTLGETETLTVALQPSVASSDVERISVSGSQALFLGAGSSSYFSGKDLSNNTSLNRDIKDVIRANPLVSSLFGADSPLIIAGSNPRFNSITVDGISQNDDFGLNGGGYPTQRSPLPIDSLDQVTVDVAPFNAKVSGFSGGLVNAVFKSGTNEWTGNVFYEKTSDHWAGTPELDGEQFPIQFAEETSGFSLGGPIIKDKLFIYGSYEKYDSPQTLDFGPAGSGSAQETDATVEEVEQVIAIARDVYGLSEEQIGTPFFSPVEEDEKYIIKLDYNISDDHRASLTYQFNEGNRTRNLTSSPGELRLSSHLYNTSEKLDNYAFKLYSDWNSDFSTELAITTKKVENRQRSFGDFADVTIDNLPSGGRIAFGSDQFRHANNLDTETFIVKLDANYLVGDHSIDFGIDFQELSIFNIFLPGSKGVIGFDSLEDFENRQVDFFEYANGTGNNTDNAAAIFDQETLALYIQDEWIVNDDLVVNLGLRYERLSSDDAPPFNQNSFDRTGLRNDANLDGTDIFLPRIGFEYTVSDEMTVRGGLGRYTGGQPNVWISNAYSQNGVNEGFFERENFIADSSIITQIPQEALDAIENAQSDGNVSFNDPNFQFPSDWRYQIAVDYELDLPYVGEGVAWTTEFLHIDRKDTAFWVDASLQPSDIEGTAADGRRILYSDDDNRYDLMLTNAGDGGRSNIFSTQFSKTWDNGVRASLSYTHQDVTEANQGTSSTARSNYRFSTAVNRNVPSDHLGRGRFEIENRFVFNLGYTTEVFEGYETDVNLFFERRSGQPVSYVANMDRNLLRNRLSPGFTSGNFLPYIPLINDPNVVYAGDVTELDVLEATAAAGLRGFAGGFAPKNYGQTPYVNRMDIAVTQEIPGLLKEHKGAVYFVMENFLNFIDSSQGKNFDSQFGTFRLYDVDSIDEEGRYVIDRVRNDNVSFQPDESTWRLKIGVRYSF